MSIGFGQKVQSVKYLRTPIEAFWHMHKIPNNLHIMVFIINCWQGIQEILNHIIKI